MYRVKRKVKRGSGKLRVERAWDRKNLSRGGKVIFYGTEKEQIEERKKKKKIIVKKSVKITSKYCRSLSSGEVLVSIVRGSKRLKVPALVLPLY